MPALYRGRRGQRVLYQMAMGEGLGSREKDEWRDEMGFKERTTYNPFRAMHSSSGKAPLQLWPLKFLPVDSVTPPTVRLVCCACDSRRMRSGMRKSSGTAREKIKGAKVRVRRRRDVRDVREEENILTVLLEEGRWIDVKLLLATWAR